MSVSKTSDKMEFLSVYLLEKIHTGEFAPGSKLPVVRELMALFDLSYGSTKRVLDKLEERQIVESRPGAGTFVREHGAVWEQKASYRIGVFLTARDRWNTPGIYPTVFLGVQNEAEQQDCALLMQYLLLDDVDSDHLRKQSEGCDGVLLLSEYDMRLSDLDLTMPVVAVCMHDLPDGRVSYLDMDPYDAARQTVTHFRSLGKERVCIYTGSAPAYINRAEIFRNLWQAHGYQAEINIITDMRQRPALPDSPEVGVLFSTGSLFLLYAEKEKEAGHESIENRWDTLTLDGKNLLDPNYPKTPAILPDWQILGRYALEECIYRIEHPGALPKRIYIPGKIVAEQDKKDL